jgi:hypothetical protein
VLFLLGASVPEAVEVRFRREASLHKRSLPSLGDLRPRLRKGWRGGFRWAFGRVVPLGWDFPRRLRRRLLRWGREGKAPLDGGGEPGAAFPDLLGPLSVELEVRLNSFGGVPAEKLRDAPGPDAGVGQFLPELPLPPGKPRET